MDGADVLMAVVTYLNWDSLRVGIVEIVFIWLGNRLRGWKQKGGVGHSGD